MLRFYIEQGEKIKAAFNAKFLVDNKTYQGEKSPRKTTQTALALALDMGLCPDVCQGKRRAKPGRGHPRERRPLDHRRHRNAEPPFGMCDNGHEEVAYQLATQTTFPSWGK